MSYFEGMPFYLALVIVLFIALIIGYLGGSLRNYGLFVSTLIIVSVFWNNPV